MKCWTYFWIIIIFCMHTKNLPHGFQGGYPDSLHFSLNSLSAKSMYVKFKYL